MTDSEPIADQVPASDSAAAKKKKPKKPTGPKKPVDVQKYQAFVGSFPIEARVSASKRKHFVAKDKVKAGGVVFSEGASAFVVRNARDTCAYCIESIQAALQQQQSTPQNGSARINPVACTNCQHAVYCSKAHQDADAAKHALECKALKEVESICERDGGDVGTIKLLLAVLSRSYLESQGTVDGALKASPVELLEDLPSHREAFENDWVKALGKALTSLQPHMPEEFTKPITEMINMACRIATYAFVLPDAKFRNAEAAFGLLPMASLFFNHSCSPNCIFTGESGGRVAFRALRDIAADEDLNVAYGEPTLLTASRDERRGHLLIQKHIWCKCRRCSTPITKSVDQYLNGILCNNCHGSLAAKKRASSSHTSGEIDASTLADMPVHVIPPRNPEMILTAARLKEAGQEPPQLQYACSRCGTDLPQSEAEAVLVAVDGEYRQCLELLRAAPTGETQKEKQLSQSQRRMTSRQRLAKFLVRYDGSATLAGLLGYADERGNVDDKDDVSHHLHPWNSFIINAIPMLMNCCISLNDLDTAAKLNRNLISRLETMAAIPNAMRSDWYVNIGDILSETAGRHVAGGHPALGKKSRAEARTAYKHAVELRAIAYGSQHPRTKAVERKLQGIAKD